MESKMNRLTDAASLRAVAGDLVRKYPTGRDHVLNESELPELLRRLMQALGLGEASVMTDSVGGQRILTLMAPGGFESYGVVIAPPGVDWSPHANEVQAVTQEKWREGIFVISQGK
jgi:hypothetical protein